MFDMPLICSYLGIVTPAFSQAWMSAEPAVSFIRMVHSTQSNNIPSIDTFFPSKSKLVSTKPQVQKSPTNCKFHLRRPSCRCAERSSAMLSTSSGPSRHRPEKGSPQHGSKQNPKKAQIIERWRQTMQADSQMPPLLLTFTGAIGNSARHP